MRVQAPGTTPKAVWDYTTAAAIVAGTLGKLITDNIDSPISTAQADLTTLETRLSALRAGYLEYLQMVRANSFSLLFNKRAETLGTDVTDGTGAVAHGQIGAGYPFHTRCTSGNVTNNDVASYGTHNIAPLAKTPIDGIGGATVFEAHVKLDQTTLEYVIIGLDETASMELPSFPCAQFLYDTGIGGNWQTLTRDAANEIQDSGIAADTDWHIFKILRTAASVIFSIDGVVVTTHVTQVPDAGAVNRTVQAGVGLRTLANVAKILRYEYVSVWGQEA